MCFFGHKWSKWSEKEEYEFSYSGSHSVFTAFAQFRTCLRCRLEDRRKV